jgi:hypothetical protein
MPLTKSLAQTLVLRFWANFGVIFTPWALLMVVYILTQLQNHQAVDWNVLYTGFIGVILLWVKQYQSTLDVKAPAKY